MRKSTIKKAFIGTHTQASQIPVERKEGEDSNVTYTHWSMDHFHLEELFILFPPLVGNESK